MSDQQTAIAPAQTGAQNLAKMLDAAGPEIAKIADRGVDLAKLFVLTRNVVASDPVLSEVLTTSEGRRSVVTAVTKLAELGLEPTGRTGGAYLVAFNTNIGTRDQPRWAKLCQVIPDWRSFLRWACGEGLADDVIPRPVHRADTFAVAVDVATGVEQIRHEYDPFGDRGPRIGWYVAILRHGAPPKYEFMSMEQIAKRRAVSKTDKVWTQWPDEMERKTVVRWAIDKRLPLGAAKLSALMDVDDETTTVRPEVAPPRAIDSIPEGRRMSLRMPEPEPEPAPAEEPPPAESPPAADPAPLRPPPKTWRDLHAGDWPTPACPECLATEYVAECLRATEMGSWECRAEVHGSKALRFHRAPEDARVRAEAACARAEWTEEDLDAAGYPADSRAWAEATAAAVRDDAVLAADAADAYAPGSQP